MKYYLYNGDDTIEMKGTNATGSNLLGINEDSNLKYYDTFPKMQFHDKGNKPTDGNNCLVFFSGFKNLTDNRANPVTYHLSDDSYYQTRLNDGAPCWLFATGGRSATGNSLTIKLNEMPVFERYLTDVNGTTVKKSLDFGTAQELYVPKYSITEDVNIYSNFWKTYLEDLYDVNTKILTVYMRLKDKVGYDLLRQFYWFENAIWRINKISDWNIGLEETVKVEFVKVQDLDNYTSVTQKKSNSITLTASKYSIPYNGETIDLTLTTRNGGDWRLVASDNSVILSKTQGTGNSNIALTIPQSRAPRTLSYFTVTAIDNEGNTASVNFTQGYDGETQLSITPQYLIVPYNGGEYDIRFNWINQGNNDITDTYIVGDVKGTVEVDGYYATISVTESQEPDTVISGKVVFDNELYDGEVYIEQMPQSLSFGKDGGEYEFIFNYNTDVSYDNVPSWVVMNGNKLTVLPNYYEIERSGNLMVKNKDSFAYVRLHQEIGESPSKENKTVSPTNLYFGIEGGTQYLNIQIPNSWILTKVGDWFTTNVINGVGTSIVGVSCGTNSGKSRTGLITVKDIVTGDEYNVSVKQIGEISDREISVTPSTIETDYKGGEYDITLTYIERNGDYVDIEGNGLTWTDIIWKGDVGTIKVTVPVNDSVETKEYLLTFKSSIGNVSVTIIQGGAPSINVDKKAISFDMYGGTTDVIVTSEIEWYATTSDSWFRVIPSTGDVGTNTVVIQTDYNSKETDRVGYVYLMDAHTDRKRATITVGQKRFIEEITVLPSTINFYRNGGTKTFSIISNTSWTIELNE
jgi:hypothetical protein